MKSETRSYVSGSGAFVAVPSAFAAADEGLKNVNQAACAQETSEAMGLLLPSRLGPICHFCDQFSHVAAPAILTDIRALLFERSRVYAT